VIEGRNVQQTLEHMDRDAGEVTFTFRMKPPMRLLKRMYRVVHARQNGERVRGRHRHRLRLLPIRR
jgi:hypothetical protein